MNEPKTFASLSPTLLARKGGAKPAMRPQLTPIGHFEDSLARQTDPEDLGWNDMGHDDEPDADDAPSGEVVHLVPEHAPEPVASLVVRTEVARPEVVRQQVDLARRVAAPPIDRRSALDHGRRAAFTLRVDAERHLKLRLACTVKGRSAQQLVTEALDKLLGDLPDLADIAERVEQSKR